MTRRVGPERSIGDSSRSQNRSLGGRGGECVENVSYDLPWRLKETMHARGLGAVERGADNSSQSRPFLPPFRRYIDT
jgi:hypothetical protein